MAPKSAPVKVKPVGQAFKDKTKPADVRSSNIQAAKGTFCAILKTNENSIRKLFAYE